MLTAIARRVVRRKEHRAFLSWYRSRFGFLPAIGAYIDLLRNNGIGRAPTGMAAGPVFLRPGTADQDVFDQVFVARDYAIDLGDPRFIVDAGAHIGLSSVYFASKYPMATVVAIEPEPSNFAILLMNTKRYPNVRAIQAGLWSREAHLRIEDPGVETWSFRVAECAAGAGIPAVTVGGVLAYFKASRIDVLKIDIEGSELEVLSRDISWIDAVRTIIVELHDRFQPGCSEALEQALRGYEYCRSLSGENVVISNLCKIVTSLLSG